MALLLVAQLGCGSEAKPVFRGLPANIMAQPRGTIGVITHHTSSSLLTAFRAMGIPYQRIPLGDAPRTNLTSYQILFLDEDVLDEDKEFVAYNHALEQVGRNGATMIIMRQPTDAMREATRKASYKIHPRDVEYRLRLVTPRKDDPMMTTPNRVTRVDLDSLGTRASQLVHGGREARAIVSANLDAPDSSAVMLWEPYAKGAVWYFSIPLADFAAAGHEGAQKIIANLVTNR